MIGRYAVMLCALDELGKIKFNADVYTVATIQEEVGLRGAIEQLWC